MAIKTHTDLDNTPVSLTMTIKELKIIERLMTKHGAEWSSWDNSRTLHQDLRDIVRDTYEKMASDSQYDAKEFKSVVVYTVKKETADA
tara:strand:- start:179 stop:442 length:264 start_codon:yes stop_codon:yes gene_type:complete